MQTTGCKVALEGAFENGYLNNKIKSDVRMLFHNVQEK